MVGNPDLISRLNSRLSEEFAAYQQYSAHYHAAENLGYDALAALIKDRAEDEARHAQLLIDRILVLGGQPVVGVLAPVNVSIADVPAAVKFDADAERTAVQRYNEDIAAAVAAGDNTTRALLESILGEEDQQHLNELEGWLIEIETIGLPPFLMLRGKG
jgi:bacterioferritin